MTVQQFGYRDTSPRYAPAGVPCECVRTDLAEQVRERMYALLRASRTDPSRVGQLAVDNALDTLLVLKHH